MKIAVLQAGRSPQTLRPVHGDYDDMSKALLGYAPQDVKTFAVMDGHFPVSADQYELYIITGSPCGVYDPLPWIPKLETFIQDVYEDEGKMIGLCFGHQIIAQALGGVVEKSHKGYGLGVMKYDLSHGNAVKHISLHAWHQDQVIVPPETARVFLTSEFCPLAGLSYGKRAISFQPHPEFTREFVRDLISVRRGETISGDLADKAVASLGRNTDTQVVQNILRDFLLG